jgi:protein ImuA
MGRLGTPYLIVFSMAWLMLQHLRQTLVSLERPPGLEAAKPTPLGIAPIDAVLDGGLAGGVLHEIAATREPHMAAVTGFALALAARGRTTVWIADDMTLIESGAPYGLGLDENGFDPARLIAVSTHPRDLFWAMEEALHCRAVGTVIGEIRQAAVDPVLLRRLSLAAARYGAMALLLRSRPPDEISTAATRWIVSAASSQPRYGPGPSRLAVTLTRNRRGPLGSWLLEWNPSDERFSLASTHPQPVARPASNRPARAVA